MADRTRIKVCGITDSGEAAALASLGVDALGFVFVRESPRYIEPELAQKIIRQLPPFVNTVGVFVNEDPDLVNDIAQYCSLTFVQLHGSEPPEYCESISSQVIKVFRVQDESSLAARESYAGLVKGFLLDTYHSDLAGGTGKSFDWRLAADSSFPGPFILAGGLNAGNVEEAIKQVRPFAVDVSSGVELEAGCKDITEVKRFIMAVKMADQDLVAIHPSEIK